MNFIILGSPKHQDEMYLFATELMKKSSAILAAVTPIKTFEELEILKLNEVDAVIIFKSEIHYNSFCLMEEAINHFFKKHNIIVMYYYYDMIEDDIKRFIGMNLP